MTRSTRRVIVASTAMAAMIWLAAPVAAQRGRDGKQNGRPQSQAGPQRAGQATPRSAPPQVRPQAAPPQQQQARPQQQQAPPPPANVARGGGPQSRNGQGQWDAYPAPRSYSQPRVAPYSSYGRSTHDVRRPVFVQPYYAFRPRFSIGFGIHIGYSVAYPYRYYDPYGFYNFRIGVVPAYGRPYGTTARLRSRRRLELRD